MRLLILVPFSCLAGSCQSDSSLSYHVAVLAEVGSYVYEVLLALVQVHAQVSLIAKPLLERTLGTLLEEIARVALESFKQVDQFGMGGMLSVSPSPVRPPPRRF